MDRTARAHVSNARLSPILVAVAVRTLGTLSTTVEFADLFLKVHEWVEHGYVDGEDLQPFTEAVQALPASSPAHGVSGDAEEALREVLDSLVTSVRGVFTENGSYDPLDDGATYYNGASVRTVGYTRASARATHSPGYVTYDTHAGEAA